MLLENLKDHNIILASQSPRRHFLLKEAGISFRLSNLHEVDEDYPPGLDKFQIPVYLAELKSNAYSMELKERDILITADTIVWINDHVINKPADREDAIRILKTLSGNMHEVITGVCIRSNKKNLSFHSHSRVFFRNLKDEEIHYYIDNYKPFDKAGAYGIQEWIGYVGICEIRGSFYNVMGLPVQQLYHELENFISDN
jgi:septum formation protein